MAPTDGMLDELLAGIEEMNERANAIAGDLIAEQMSWSPTAAAWSIGQCLEHLVVTGSLYNERIGPAIQRAREKSGGRSPRAWRPSLAGRFMINAVKPGGRAVRTLRVFEPTLEPRADVLAEFVAIQKGLSEHIAAARGVDLMAAKVTSPATRLLRLNIGDCFRMLTLHADRHLLQAARVRGNDSFPK